MNGKPWLKGKFRSAVGEPRECDEPYEYLIDFENVQPTAADMSLTSTRSRMARSKTISLKRQLYVGPDAEPVRSLVAQARARRDEPLLPLARSAIALGCAPVLPRHFRVIRRLSEHGFFLAGGVLIGTHAFLSYGNILGLRWSETARTQDGDLAHAGKSVSRALPPSLRAAVPLAEKVARSLGGSENLPLRRKAGLRRHRRRWPKRCILGHCTGRAVQALRVKPS